VSEWGTWLTCPDGYEWTSSSSCTIWSAGLYSVGGAACQQCAAGTYNNGTGNTGCTVCEPGYTCSGLGTTGPTRNSCPGGTYSDQGAT